MAPDKPWKAPVLGSPIWIEIPANDMKSTSAFYRHVFGFPFYETQPEGYDDKQVRLFEFADPRISGGLLKPSSEVNEGKVRGGRGGVCVWWLVADVEAVVGEIEKAGGRVVSDTLKEGANGLYRYFEDPEGNVGVAYQFVGKRSGE